MKKFKWVICECCEGSGKVDNPAFSNGITSSEWAEWGEEDHLNYIGGFYDVCCPSCRGSGKRQVPIVSALSFAEKRELVQQRRDNRELAECDRIHAMERMLGC
ncbi:hypothetical protein GTU79_21325 [Sodalis ligni]|uniref:hypothetical protein n=1 Tax=Sodalis ligni TaxID=2697027 RepID=UPI00193F0D11|nr:hypothetical protein [Sodalis ligni]QWA09825.1 hypothetical protein GTU79_21325 [Sodalis ligni]